MQQFATATLRSHPDFRVKACLRCGTWMLMEGFIIEVIQL